MKLIDCIKVEACKTKKQQKCHNFLGPKLYNMLYYHWHYQNIQDLMKFKENVQKISFNSENYYKIIIIHGLCRHNLKFNIVYFNDNGNFK